jgi:hypothetical protein
LRCSAENHASRVAAVTARPVRAIGCAPRVVSLRRVAGHAPIRAHKLGLVLERDPGARPDGFDHEPFAGLRGEPGGRRTFTARLRRGRRVPPAAVQCSGEGDQSSTACACHDLASIPCANSPPARPRAPSRRKLGHQG